MVDGYVVTFSPCPDAGSSWMISVAPATMPGGRKGPIRSENASDTQPTTSPAMARRRPFPPVRLICPRAMSGRESAQPPDKAASKCSSASSASSDEGSSGSVTASAPAKESWS